MKSADIRSRGMAGAMDALSSQKPSGSCWQARHTRLSKASAVCSRSMTRMSTTCPSLHGQDAGDRFNGRHKGGWDRREDP